MNIALLPQRAVELLSRRLRRHGTQPSALPPYTSLLFRLAHIAVGDADSAAVLAADVLATGPADTYPDEVTALRSLIQRIPEGWLSWPGAAGPAEWLRMRVRREQADRVLSVLGEWDASARVALGLWLLWNVRRDDLDAWLGTQGMADRMTELVGCVGEGLGVVGRPGNQAACVDVAADLIDAHEPEVGRAVRLHMLGCETCRHRAAGLRSTVQVLRNALDAFFRAPPPANLAQLVALHRIRSLPKLGWQPVLIVLVALSLLLGLVRKPAVTAAPVLEPASAAELIDRALNRFAAAPAHDGVLHERLRMNDGGEQFFIERWYEYGPRQRMRITVRQGALDAPLLDLSTDGAERVAYEVDTGMGLRRNALVRGGQAERIAPLLRQLPVVGSFGDSVVPQRYLDISLLAAARRNNATLLGTARWHGRAAYTMMSSLDGERLTLTLDQTTLSLLEARLTPTVQGAATARRVWQAELVEVLPRNEVVPATFELTRRDSVMSLADPRQFGVQPSAFIDLVSAVAKTKLLIPSDLPETPVLAYLRVSSRWPQSIVQMYEGSWSTLAITGAFPIDWWRFRALEQKFAHGRFTELKHNLPNTTVIEFALDARRNERMRIYFWHALATDAERSALSHQILHSLTLVDATNHQQFGDRFVVPQADEITDALGLPRLSLGS